MSRLGKSANHSSAPSKTTGGFWAYFSIIIVAVDHLAKWEGLWQFFNSTPPAEWLQQRGIQMTPYTFFLIVAAIILFVVFLKDKAAFRNYQTTETSQFFWRPWIMVGALAAIFLIDAFVKPVGHSKSSDFQSTPHSVQFFIPNPIQEYEEFCKTNIDGSLFFNKGIEAFKEKQFAYVLMLFEQGRSRYDKDNTSWQSAEPILFAARYALNSIESGRNEFENSIKNQLTEIQNGKGYSTQSYYLACLIENYSVARQYLSPAEQEFLDSVSDQVKELKKKADKESHAP